MGKAQRDKGNRGEREVANLIADHLGYSVTRRVRQHGGDSDLIGVPFCSLEVKNHATATRSQISTWWNQTCSQAAGNGIPVLAYKRSRGWWRFVWPPNAACLDIAYAVEGDIEAFAVYVRESLPTTT